MNTKVFINRLKNRLTPKNKIILSYLNAKHYASKINGKFSSFSLMDYYEKGLFDEDEYTLLTSARNFQEICGIRTWNKVLNLIFLADEMAYRYFFQTTFTITLYLLNKNIKDSQNNFDWWCLQFYVYSFSTLVLNKLFYEQIDLTHKNVLDLIYIFGFKNIYIKQRRVIKNEALFLIKEIAYYVKNYEYVSDSQIERYIDEVDQLFTGILHIA